MTPEAGRLIQLAGEVSDAARAVCEGTGEVSVLRAAVDAYDHYLQSNLSRLDSDPASDPANRPDARECPSCGRFYWKAKP